MSDSPDSKLTTQALNMAYTVRLNPKNVLFHSDQGTLTPPVKPMLKQWKNARA